MANRLRNLQQELPPPLPAETLGDVLLVATTSMIAKLRLPYRKRKITKLLVMHEILILMIIMRMNEA